MGVQVVDGNLELERAKDTIGMLANQTSALEGCVELQEKHITKLLEKLQGISLALEN